MKKPDTKQFSQFIEGKRALIPLHRPGPDGKKPLHKNWTKRRYSYEEITGTYAGHNIGVALAATDLVVDVDPRHGGKEGLAKLRAAFPGIAWKQAPRVVTGSGGLHLYFTKPAEIAVMNMLKEFPGVEFKSLGRQMLIPGDVHPDTGELYKWRPESRPLADAFAAPDDLLQKIARPAPTTGAEPGEITPEQLAGMLECLPVEEFGEHDSWLKLMCAAHHATGGDGREEFIAWSTSDPKFADHGEIIERRWDSLSAKPGAITAKSLYRAVHDHGGGHLIPADEAEFPEDEHTREADEENLLNGNSPESKSAGEEIEPSSDDVVDPAGSVYETKYGISLANMADLKPEKYKWLWGDRFVAGALNVIFGEPGNGKGMLIAEIASILSRGDEWPNDEGKAEVCESIILTAEDAANSTILPRLMAANADRSKIWDMQSSIIVHENVVKKGKTKKRKRLQTFNLSTDLKRLSLALRDHPNVRVLFIDPINAFIGGGKNSDSFRASDVRLILTPLKAWAEKHDVCVILISHLNKSGTGSALNRMTDSHAFGAAVRMAWAVGRDPDDPDGGSRIMARAKANITAERPDDSLKYKIVSKTIEIDGEPDTRGAIEWLGKSKARANDVLNSSTAKVNAYDAAKKFLKARLSDGPEKSKTLEKEVEALGMFSWRTAKRAKAELGIYHFKEDGKPNGKILWRLPPALEKDGASEEPFGGEPDSPSLLEPEPASEGF